MVLNIQNLIDDAKCFETVRELRWPGGVTCPGCGNWDVTRQGHDDTQTQRQRYQCQACRKRFDDLTGTIFAGHHRPLRTWILCLYFMGLNSLRTVYGADPEVIARDYLARLKIKRKPKNEVTV